MPEGRPAATVILLRDGAAGVETLLLRRSDSASFGPGSAVFPGGRVDDGDWAGLAPDDELGAARRAAVRETHEEAGLVIDGAALVPHSHWQPPPHVPTRYLTWFFVGSAPDAVVAVDGAEIVDHEWMRPEEALDRHGRGELELMPPTWVTLHGLAGHASVHEAVEEARRRPPRLFESHWVPTDTGPVFLYEGDGQYQRTVPDLDASGPRRRLDARTKPWRWLESS